jgi:long-chain fatty acid transport protein
LAVVATGLVAATGATHAHASGLALYPGTDAAGMAGAFRAVADDWSAAFWNPAGLVNLPGTQLSATGTFVLPNLTVTPAPLNGFATTRVYQDREVIAFPGVSGFARVTDEGKYSYGFGVFAPFGLGTKWDLYNLPPGYNDRVTYPKFDHESDLKVVDLHPTFAIQVSPSLAAGAGLSINYASLTLRQVSLQPNGILAQAPELSPLIRAPFDVLPVDVDVSGTGFGFGGNAGLLWKAGDKLSVGVSVRAYTDLDVSGDGTLTGYFPYSQTDSAQFASVFAGLIAQYEAAGDPQDAAVVRAESTLIVPYWLGGVVPATYSASAKIPLPLNAGVGLAYKITPKWLFAADVDWTQQSVFDTIILKLRNRSNVPAPYGESIDDALKELWHDVTRVSVGSRYAVGQVRGLDLTLLGGYYHDPSPAPNSTLTPIIPDGKERHVFQVGGSLGTSHFKFTGVYKYIYTPDRTVDAYVYNTSGLSDVARDVYHLAGVPQNLAGTYHLRVHEWITGVQYTF